jgi:hypothetical protein
VTADDFITTAAREIAVARQLGDGLGEGWALYELGSVLAGLERFEEANAAFDRLRPVGQRVPAVQAIVAAREENDWQAESRALFGLREALAETGRCDEAERAKEQARRFTRSHLDRLRWEQSEAVVREAMQAAAEARESGDRLKEAWALSKLSSGLRNTGRPDEADEAAACSEQIHRELDASGRLVSARRREAAARAYGDRSSEAMELFKAAGALADLGQAAEAESAVLQAERLVEDVVDATEQAVLDPAWGVEWLAAYRTLDRLRALLADAGRATAARHVRERAALLDAAALEASVDVASQLALDLAADAREREDRGGEVRALVMLAHSLRETGDRRYEVAFCYEEALRVAKEITDERDRESAMQTLADIGPRPFPYPRRIDATVLYFESMEQARSARPEAQGSYHPPEETARIRLFAGSLLDDPVVVEAMLGFVVLKVLGPFAEEFAKVIGKSLGESTVRAFGRLRLRLCRLWGNLALKELDVMLPDSAPTTLVLPPGQLTEEQRLGLIDLDLTDPKFAGATVHWDYDAGEWLPR